MTEKADDVQVLSKALRWLQAGQSVALVMVMRTWGSSPRPPGSLMAMNKDGQFVGSVSGGCIEDALIERYRNNEIAGPQPVLLDFGVDRQESSRMGLPCGGRLEVMLEHLDETGQIKSVLDSLHQGELIARKIDLVSGEVSLIRSDGHAEFQVCDQEVIKTFGPSWELLLIGDGQLARHLASMAQQLDYDVTICDPRDEYLYPDSLEGVTYRREMPDDVVKALSNHKRTAIVALAHDPRQDDLGLSEALDSEAFYIGALGSQKSAQARRERLASLGYSSKQIARIHGPAGLSIGSKRPSEIAVSILAQITAVRNGISESIELQE